MHTQLSPSFICLTQSLYRSLKDSHVCPLRMSWLGCLTPRWKIHPQPNLKPFMIKIFYPYLLLYCMNFLNDMYLNSVSNPTRSLMTCIWVHCLTPTFSLMTCIWIPCLTTNCKGQYRQNNSKTLQGFQTGRGAEVWPGSFWGTRWHLHGV